MVDFGRFLGQNELQVIPQVDFDIVDSILRILEGSELGNEGLYTKYWQLKQNHKKIKILFWSRESNKLIFTIFSGFFRKNPENGNLE